MTWGLRYIEMGGYDCMTDAIHIGESASCSPIVIDLSSFGQRPCFEPAPESVTRAMGLAQRIVDGLNRKP